jgi:tRNA-Thr(GGU) m(6)t(6)A37 methyltransferase TsaA
MMKHFMPNLSTKDFTPSQLLSFSRLLISFFRYLMAGPFHAAARDYSSKNDTVCLTVYAILSQLRMLKGEKRLKISALREYAIRPIGIVRNKGERPHIEIYPEYMEGLSGLSQFSHITVLFWFDQNDTPKKRKTLKVHPRGDRSNPLTGVFATRSPARPNLIGMTVCELLSVADDIIRIDRIDALDDTPVIDIKPCIARLDLITRLRAPAWAESPGPSPDSDTPTPHQRKPGS